MDTNTISTFFAVSAVLLLSLVAGTGVLWVWSRYSERAANWLDTIIDSMGSQALGLAWLMAIVAMAGSLYYSEVADFVPCRLCWYQRIAMYPLAVVLGVAYFRRDRSVGRYVFPLTFAGGGVAVYHYLLQHFPSLSTGACSASAPCTAAWVWKFDFVSIPFMALAVFATITTLLLLGRAEEPSSH